MQNFLASIHQVGMLHKLLGDRKYAQMHFMLHSDISKALKSPIWMAQAAFALLEIDYLAEKFPSCDEVLQECIKAYETMVLKLAFLLTLFLFH